MAYGHAERTLAAIRLLETQTVKLLYSLPWLGGEQASWLKEAVEARSRTMNAPAGGQEADDSLGADR